MRSPGTTTHGTGWWNPSRGTGGRGVAVTTAAGVPSLDALCDRRQILQLSSKIKY